MDGIFVAYHNAFEMFGFQYISLEEMDERIYGNSQTAEAAFNLILQIYNEILEAVVALYPPEHVIRLTFSPDKMGTRLTVYAEDAGQDGTQVGRHVRQFAVSLTSSLNGFRAEQILLEAGAGPDQWIVNYSLAPQTLNSLEYEATRGKVTMVTRGGEIDDARGIAFLRNIRNSVARQQERHQRRPLPQEGGEAAAIIAPWTLL